MPSRVKKRSRKPEVELDLELAVEFQIGWSLDHTHPDEERRKEVKELWKKYGKHVMNLWFSDSQEAEKLFIGSLENRLFTRPDAWWRFSAPEPRKFYDTGYPAMPKVPESELDYLVRTNQLTDQEKEILKQNQS